VPSRLLIAIALVGALLAAPATADAAKRKVPRHFFGAMWDREVSEGKDSVQKRGWTSMARNGVESSRVVFSWYLAQPSPGVTTYRRTDPAVRHAALHGIDLLPVVTYAPDWARVQPMNLSSAPSNVPAYVEYLELLIARYGPDGQFWKDNPAVPYRPVRKWQIWNEPHIREQWTPQDNWQMKYGELLRASYPAVKKADPGAEVVLAGLANASWIHLDELYEFGGIKGYFDVAAVHYYERNSAEFVEAVRRNRQTLRRHGDPNIPIWLTEAGSSASRGKVRMRGAGHMQTTDKGMARQLTRMYRYLVRHRSRYGLQRVYWYTWASAYQKRQGVFAYSGLNAFTRNRLKAKPALAAYRKLARRYEGCRKDSRARCVGR
jgi:hypothetical protein